MHEVVTIIGWGAIMTIKELQKMIEVNQVIIYDERKYESKHDFVKRLCVGTEVLFKCFDIDCCVYYERKYTPYDVFICINKGKEIVDPGIGNGHHIKLDYEPPDEFKRFVHFISHEKECGYLLFHFNRMVK